MKESVNHVFDVSALAISLRGDCLDSLRRISYESIQWIVTSPPYNIGKDYEDVVPAAAYLAFQRQVLSQKNSVTVELDSKLVLI